MGIICSDGKFFCSNCNEEIVGNNKIKFIQFENNHNELMCENCFNKKYKNNKKYKIEEERKYTKFSRFEIIDI